MLTVREYVSITNNSVGEVLATEVLKRGEEMMAEHRGFIASNKKIVTEWCALHLCVCACKLRFRFLRADTLVGCCECNAQGRQPRPH